LITALVPIAYRSSWVGSSTVASRWATMTISFFFRRQRGLDSRHARGPAHRERHDDGREQHRVLDRQKWQRLQEQIGLFAHVPALLDDAAVRLPGRTPRCTGKGTS
jgi:hypothetical protein